MGKSNIAFAKDVFNFIKEQEDCVAIALDIRGFYDSLDFKKLKKPGPIFFLGLICQRNKSEYRTELLRNSNMKVARICQGLLNTTDKVRAPRQGFERNGIICYNQSMEIQYGGQCAFALSTGKKGVAGNEKYRLEKDGKVYLFSNPVAKILFYILPNRVRKADLNWQK